MKKRNIIAWTIALPLALWGATCLPPLSLESLVGIWMILPVIIFIIGLELFIILGTS